jgi:multidrug efflux pump subunit AcrB
MKDGKARRQGLIGKMARNSVAANLLMMVFLLGGFLVLPRIRQEVFPEFDLDIVTVRTVYQGASPLDVEEGILLAVEEAIRGIDGVDRITSIANEGFGTVTAELQLSADGNQVLQDIKSAVDRIVTFPLDAERPVVQLVRARSLVLNVLIYGDLTMQELKDLAELARDELLRDPAISTIEVAGLPPVELAIEIPQQMLRSRGLSIPEVARTLGAASLDMAGGGIRADTGEILLRLSDRRDTAEAYRAVPLVTTSDGVVWRVGDLAEVIDGFQETDEALSYNGARAVSLQVFRTGPEKPLDISAAAWRFADAFRQRLPEGVDITVAGDRSEVYRDRIDLLMRNAMLGLVLVMIILGLFLEIRLAFWVMMGIPISFMGSLLFLPQADVSINMISLFAFIISLGIVVDDAVVVGENVYHLREKGLSNLDAAIEGARQMAIPVILSILTNITAVLPLLFVPGAQGKIWRNIPIIMTLVFVISLMEALFILPAHLGHQKAGSERGFWRIMDAPQRFFGKGLAWFIARMYSPALRAALAFRYLTMAIGVAALVLTIGYLRGGRMRFVFFPQVESDRVTAAAALPFGSPVEASRAVERRLLATAQSVLDELGGVRVVRGIESSVGRHLGGGGPMAGASQSGGHLVGVAVNLEPLDVRGFSAADFTRKWREATGDLPGLESLSFRFTIGPAAQMPIDVQLSHRDSTVIEAAARATAAALADFSGVLDIDNGIASGKPEIAYQLREEARLRGLTSADVGRQVRAAFFGAEVTRQQRGRDEMRVLVRLPSGERARADTLEGLVLRLPDGGEMAFVDAVFIERGRSYDVIRRDQGRRILSVTADIDIRSTSAGEVIAALNRDVMPGIVARYPGLTYSFEGQSRDQQQAFRSIGVGFLAAVFVIFALLAIPFGSYLHGLIVLTAVPFGFTGAILGHMIMGYNLSFVSVMGIVALAGVVVNDNLILVDTINRLRRDGMSLAQAVAEGPIRRFRPVLLTSATTFFGLAPMIFEESVQARFMIPMALSLGFGIVYATLIALLLTPCLYLVLESAKARLAVVFPGS